jgi:myo-inositol-1(or 4)-monophosphatase
VGLLADGEPAAGAVAMPAVSEGVWGAVGLGAWLNGQPVRRGPTVLGSNSLLSVTTGALRRFGPPPHEMGHVRAHGSIAWEMALCACGQVDAAVLSRWKPWDVVAGAAVVVAAGGMVVTAEEGAPVPSWTGEYRGEIVAGGPNLGDLVPETVPGWRIR